MKPELDVRPVFVQKEKTIEGHFLICYLTVLLERIFQFKIMDDKSSASEIFSFIKGFKSTRAERNYINTSIHSDLIEDLTDRLNLPLTICYLHEVQIRAVLNYQL